MIQKPWARASVQLFCSLAHLSNMFCFLLGEGLSEGGVPLGLSAPGEPNEKRLRPAKALWGFVVAERHGETMNQDVSACSTLSGCRLQHAPT
jgi:hypothetical protein